MIYYQKKNLYVNYSNIKTITFVDGVSLLQVHEHKIVAL